MMDAETPLLLGQRRPRRPARAALLVAASLALFAAASRSSLARGGALAMVDVSDAPSDDAAQGAPSDAPADDAAQGAPSDDASASIASAGSTVSSTGDDAAPQQEEQGQDEQGQDAALTAPSSAPTAPPSAAAQLQQQGQAAQGQDEQPAQQQDPGQLNASSALAPLGDDDDADAGTQYCNESISKLAFSVSEPAAAHAFVSRYFPVTCEANGGFEGYSLCSHNSSCGAFASVTPNSGPPLLKRSIVSRPRASWRSSFTSRTGLKVGSKRERYSHSREPAKVVCRRPAILPPSTSSAGLSLSNVADA